MFQFGSGYSIIIHKKYTVKEKGWISEFIIDETLIQIGKDYFWLWVAIENRPIRKF
jgi:transposase-like protein